MLIADSDGCSDGEYIAGANALPCFHRLAFRGGLSARVMNSAGDNKIAELKAFRQASDLVLRIGDIAVFVKLKQVSENDRGGDFAKCGGFV